MVTSLGSGGGLGVHAPGSTITGIDAYGQPVYSDQLMYVSMSYRINGVEHPTWAYNPGYIVPQQNTAPAPTVSTPTPPPMPPHLQFTPGTIGASTFLALGRCRLPGQIIWASGVASSTSTLITSLLTCALAYCEPIDPTESVVIHQMSANGTVFYDLDHGGVITLASIPAEDQQRLATCIANMRVYLGKEDQLADPTIAASQTVPAACPAFRGLRYIVLRDFPLSVAGNTVPNIAIEWRRTGDPLLNVSDVLIALAARRGITLSSVGMSDTCQGFVTNSQGSVIETLHKHADPYNYQIADGSPIKIIQRAVDGSLTIDLEATEENCVRSSATVALTRADPAMLPKGIEVQYTDSEFAYDTKVQQARHDGSGISSAVISIPIDFVIDKTTARRMAFGTLYRIRSRGLTARFELKDFEPEVGDIVRMTSAQGIFVLLVEEQNYTKARSNAIRATALLTSSGVTVSGTSGSSTTPPTILWPEEAVNGAVNLVTDSGRIYTSSADGIDVNSAYSPARKIGTDAVYTDAGFTAPADAVYDAGYVYIIENGDLVRISRQAFDGVTKISAAVPFSTATQLAVYSGRLYFVTASDNGTLTALRLWIMDLANFSAAGLSSLDLIAAPVSAAEGYISNGLCMVGTKLAISTVKFDAVSFSSSTLYAVDVNTLAVTTFALTHDLGRGLTSGANGYFLPATVSYDLARVPLSATEFFLAKFDGATVSYVDIRTDTNIINAADSKSKPWSDGSNVCFLANVELDDYTDVGFVNAPYLARFNLATMASAGGVFLAQYFDSFSPDGGITYAGQFISGAFFNGYHYLAGEGHDDRYTGGIYLTLSSDFITSQFFPALPLAPANDEFATPFYIAESETVTGLNTYATKQTGEPDHAGNVGGHSLWWLFVPTTSGDYTVDTTASTFHSLVGVYEGTDITLLDELAFGDNVTATFYGRAGNQYRIAVDGFGGATGTALLAMSAVTIIALDDDEDFVMLMGA